MGDHTVQKYSPNAHIEIVVWDKKIQIDLHEFCRSFFYKDDNAMLFSISKSEIYIKRAPNNSNETYT